MLTREERKKRRGAKCRHFNGMQNLKCKTGIEYPKDENHREEFSCFGEKLKCNKYETLTAEEIRAEEAEIQRVLDLFCKGLSSCCEAPIDTSQVITKGQFKNHGPRFCSKCKRVCFMV